MKAREARPHIKEWLVRLKGDLTELPLIFSSPALTVISQRGKYYLKAESLNSLQDPQEALRSATPIVESASGAARLFFEHYSGFEVDHAVIGLDNDGQQHPYQFGYGTSRPSNEAYGDPNDVLEWIRKAALSEEVRDALRFYNKQTWSDLYRAYEIIEDSVGDPVKKNWITKRNLSRFTQTSQSRDSIGDAARHAKKKYKAHPNPMSFSEASCLVKGLLVQWLRGMS